MRAQRKPRKPASYGRGSNTFPSCLNSLWTNSPLSHLRSLRINSPSRCPRRSWNSTSSGCLRNGGSRSRRRERPRWISLSRRGRSRLARSRTTSGRLLQPLLFRFSLLWSPLLGFRRTSSRGWYRRAMGYPCRLLRRGYGNCFFMYSGSSSRGRALRQRSRSSLSF